MDITQITHSLQDYDVSEKQFVEAFEATLSLGKKKKASLIREMTQKKFLLKLYNFFERLNYAKDHKAYATFYTMLIDNIMTFCNFIIESCHDVAHTKDFHELLIILKKSINAANTMKIIDRHLLLTFVELDELYRERFMKNTTKNSFKQTTKNTDKARDDFRNTSLLPTNEEILQTNFNAIKENIIKGAYDNVDHYLDIHYRLLREDYIDAVRSGLKKYGEALADGTTYQYQRYDNIRVYSGVHFEKKRYGDIGSVAYVVNFDPESRLNIDFNKQRIFMHGSLLLFSRNNFKTFFCAIIYHYNIELLNSGRLYVVIEDNGDFNENVLFISTYTMIEADAFWEPYTQVLQVFKNFTEESFPMSRYIIEASPEVETPDYLFKYRNWDILGYKTQANDFDTWPSAKSINLDQHQYKALKTALTKQFSVIQGPPGTGKTFLGLKIVEVLLTNMDICSFFIKNPILVICFTNHALDQFLEGIMQFNDRITRVGGQSRSELLKQCNLKEKKARRKGSKFGVNEEERKLRVKISKRLSQLKNLLDRMDQLEQNIDILSKPKGILSVEYLKEYMGKQDQKLFESDNALIWWLLDEKEANFPSSHKVNDFTCLEELKYEIVVDENALKDEIFGELFKSSKEEEPDENEADEYSEEVLKYSISLDGLGAVCLHYKEKFDLMKDTECITYTWAKQQLSNLVHRFFILKENLDKSLVDELLHSKTSQKDSLTLPLDHRWNTYFYWLEAKKKAIKKKINEMKKEYHRTVAEIELYQQEQDAAILSSDCVVGMTTTRAARMHKVLEKLKPSIVIVEEAAEVLESHIVASLTKHTDHVILIGDHKQLKPTTAVYELSRKYNLDTSLFERMINNGMECPVLKVQHRMRPEVSCLITPSIYKELENHKSVTEYEHINGISKDVFFLEHNIPEDEVENSTSYKNVHEADFVIELCLYLVNQGYDSNSITMLTTYGAQMQYLKEARKKHSKIAHVHTCVVDEYQGEENDIIILSLVRSNTSGNIGFLKIENRVCVALTRVKKGFYVIGNMELLAKASPLWHKIRKTLRGNNSIGSKLVLRCNKHGTLTEVKEAQDFAAVEGGGCRVKCQDVLHCSHVCMSNCHIADPNHENEFACRSVCTRKLNCGHKVILPCSVRDYQCKELVAFKSQFCKHFLERECWNPCTSDIVCKNICFQKLPCNHLCQQVCHPAEDHSVYLCEQPCLKKNKLCSKNHLCQKKCYEDCGECTELQSFYVQKCGHTVMLPCSTKPNEVKCTKICGKICSKCRKECEKQCWEDCRPCMNEVKKMIFECHHFMKVPCSWNRRKNYAKYYERFTSLPLVVTISCMEWRVVLALLILTSKIIT